MADRSPDALVFSSREATPLTTANVRRQLRKVLGDAGIEGVLEAEVSRFRYTIAMTTKPLARDELWDIATTQHGFVTAQQATEAGIGKQALQMLVHRGTLERAAHGVYRFPQYPAGEHDQLMLAVLWTRVPEAALSHETALDCYGISDVNPNRIHLAVGKHRRFRRAGADDYVVHYEDLEAKQIPVDAERLHREMDRLLAVAKQQIVSEVATGKQAISPE